jgi:ABC-type oligopeptide transport system substrate-binding subunit
MTATLGPDIGIFRQTLDFGRFDRLKTWVTMATFESKPEFDPSFDAIEFADLGAHQLIFNNARAPFKRLDIRRAVGLALNYSLLAEKLQWAPETLQEGLIPLGMPGFKKRDLSNYQLRLNQAKHLLHMAGFSDQNPLRFSILLSKLPTYQKEAELWPLLFGDAPIKVTVELVDHAERNARQNRGDFQALRGLKFAGSIEAHRLLATYLSGSSLNPTRSRLRNCDKLILNSATASDRERRFNQYKKSEQCLLDKSILLPLASIQTGYVFLRKPWKLSRTNRYLLHPYWISEWRIDDSK